MRLVLDTNVLARVVISPHGLAAELFDRVRLEHVLVSSSAMLAELSRVLAYDRVRKLHLLDDGEIDEFVRGIEAGSILVALPADIPAVVQADPDDDAVVATAILGEADAICTRTVICTLSTSSPTCGSGRSRSSTMYSSWPCCAAKSTLRMSHDSAYR